MQTCFGQHVRQIGSGDLTVTETVHGAGLHVPPHEHSYSCVHFVLDGEYCESIRGSSFRLGRHQFLFKPTGVRHSNRFGDVSSRCMRIESEREFCAEISAGPMVGCDPFVSTMGRQLFAELRDPDAFSPLVIEGLCLEVFARIGRIHEGNSAESGGRMHAAVIECGALLRGALPQPIQLSQLAERLGVDRSSLCKEFRMQYGCTMGEYLRRVRIERAMRLLTETRESIAGIAVRTGFFDQSHLTRVFRQMVGATPHAWRGRMSKVRE